ncbi:MAG: iron permease [Variovorax sp.]|nr:MAG: iron permease [Variovorax sp.]
MSNPSRRAFVMGVVAAGPVFAASQVAAQAAAVSETDPQAVALGFKNDTTKVDKAKFPKHEATQVCSGCALYQGKAADANGPCALFSMKTVPAKGWCSSWVKKT